MNQTQARCSRILVKLSGEALLGRAEYGIDADVLKRVASEIRDVQALGVEVAIVIGGGNLFRGAGLARAGMDRVTADQMGMLATVMNALALQDALESQGMQARVMPGATKQIAAPDHDGDFDAERLHIADLAGHALEHVGIDAVSARPSNASPESLTRMRLQRAWVWFIVPFPCGSRQTASVCHKKNPAISGVFQLGPYCSARLRRLPAP